MPLNPNVGKPIEIRSDYGVPLAGNRTRRKMEIDHPRELAQVERHNSKKDILKRKSEEADRAIEDAKKELEQREVFSRRKETDWTEAEFHAPKQHQTTKSVPIDGKRLHLHLTVNSHERLMRIMEYSEAPSISAVVRHALQVYELMISEEQDGAQIVIEKSDGTKYIVKLVI